MKHQENFYCHQGIRQQIFINIWNDQESSSGEPCRIGDCRGSMALRDSLYWMPDKTNPADLFTKEDTNVQHFELLCGQMLMPQEAFSKSSLAFA